jgi:hypothetical protein
MIAKVFSVLTLLIAAGAAYLGFEGHKMVTLLQDDIKDTKTKLATEIRIHNQTKETLKETQKKLADTEEILESTKRTLRETEATLATTKSELDKTKMDLVAKANELEEIRKLFPDPEVLKNLKAEVEAMTTKVKDQEMKIGTLEKEKIELTNAVASLEGTLKQKEEKIVQDGKIIKKHVDKIMEKGIRGRVMAVNPGWGFAVLSIGDKQGAASSRVMIVGRNGQAIGKVKITSVEANQSIADIMPGTFVRGMSIEPGDDVIYTGDDKVPADVVAGATPAAGGAALDLPTRNP